MRTLRASCAADCVRSDHFTPNRPYASPHRNITSIFYYYVFWANTKKTHTHLHIRHSTNANFEPRYACRSLYTKSLRGKGFSRAVLALRPDKPLNQHRKYEQSFRVICVAEFMTPGDHRKWGVDMHFDIKNSQKCTQYSTTGNTKTFESLGNKYTN